MLLAIDTSTVLTGLACYDQCGLLGESVWQSGRNHTAQLLPQLDMLLRHLERGADELKAVAVARGPGSWSGLRAGMSLAKGIALAGGLVLLGIGTLDAIAYQHQYAAMPIYPLIRLGRDRFATAKFDYADAQQRLGDYTSVSLADLCARVEQKTLFCGDIDAEVQTWIRDNVGEDACFPTPAVNLRRPGYLAELAWQRLAAGESDNLAQLEPFYLGEPVRTEASGL